MIVFFWFIFPGRLSRITGNCLLFLLNADKQNNKGIFMPDSPLKIPTKQICQRSLSKNRQS